MKKIIFFAGIFIATIVVVLWAGRKAPSVVPSPAAPTPTIDMVAIPTLATAPITNKQQVTFSISSLPQVYPQSIQIYSAVRQVVSADAARELASSFAMSGAPVVSKTTVGNEYIWLAGKKQFSVSDGPPSVSFRDEQTASPPGPDEAAAVQSVIQFLTDKKLLASTMSTSPLQTKYFLINESTNREESQSRANLALIGLQYKIGNYPLYQQERYAASITALVGANSHIRSVTVAIPPVVTPLGEKPVVSPAQAAIMLQNNKGSLVSVSGQTYDSGISPSFTHVNISAVYIAYFEEKKSGTLTPVYVFEGVASGGGSLTDGARVVYMVPATP